MVIEGISRTPLRGMDAFQNFFDPNGEVDSLGDLIAALAEKRKAPIDVSFARGIGKRALKMSATPENTPLHYSETELVIAEAAAFGFFPDAESRQAFSQASGIAIESINTIINTIEQHADAISQRVVDMVQATQESHRKELFYSRLLDVSVTAKTSPIVTAGLLLAAAAHFGERRKNGARPYMTHVVGTAQLYQMAWDEVAAKYKSEDRKDEIPDQKYRHRQIAVNLLHDSVENSIPNDGTSFFADGEPGASRVTPLLIRKTLEKLGVDPEAAQGVVDDILAVTKTVDVNGIKVDNNGYRDRYKVAIRPLLAKIADMLYNGVIDPKVATPETAEKIKSTEQEYGADVQTSMKQLAGTMQDGFGADCAYAMIRIANEHKGYDAFASAAQRVGLGHVLEDTRVPSAQVVVLL